MSAAKHTPGPWQRSGVRVKLGAEDCLQVGPSGFPIAFLPIGNRPSEQAGAIADANLITASPDLLAFAEAYRRDLQERGLRESDLDACQMELLNMADAAIAKATGSAS